MLACAAVAVVCLSECRENDSNSLREKNAFATEEDSVESIAKELQEKMREFAAAVRSATDTASAEKAADTLTELGGEMKMIAERLAELEIPSEAVRVELGNDLRKVEEEIENQMGDVEEFWEKLDPAANEAFEEGMKAFGMKMQEAMVVFKEYFEMERGAK